MSKAPVIDSLLYIKSVLPGISGSTTVSLLALAETRYLSATGMRLTDAAYICPPSRNLTVEQPKPEPVAAGDASGLIVMADGQPAGRLCADRAGPVAVSAINATIDDLVQIPTLLTGATSGPNEMHLSAVFTKAVHENPFFPRPEESVSVDLEALYAAGISVFHTDERKQGFVDACAAKQRSRSIYEPKIEQLQGDRKFGIGSAFTREAPEQEETEDMRKQIIKITLETGQKLPPGLILKT